MILAAWHIKDVAAVLAPTVVLLVGVVTLLINGQRAERGRRRDLHARGLAAALAYAEMPFEIRRRQHEPKHHSAERVRLATRFSEIQAELSVCHALIAAEADTNVLAAFTAYVNNTRTIAGGAARESWNTDPITADTEVNMPELGKHLQQLADSRDTYVEQIRLAARSSWHKIRDATGLPPDHP